MVITDLPVLADAWITPPDRLPLSFVIWPAGQLFVPGMLGGGATGRMGVERAVVLRRRGRFQRRPPVRRGERASPRYIGFAQAAIAALSASGRVRPCGMSPLTTTRW